MKLNWLCTLFLTSALGVSASAQVSLYVGTAPPALRYEQRGPAPGEGYAWVDGYWAPHGHSYAWVAGRWDHPPYAGAHWSHAHYDHQRQGWQLHEGHWDHDDHEGHGH